MLPCDNSRRPWWRDFAATVAQNGFSPVAILPGTKRPRFEKWAVACYAPTNSGWIVGHGRKHGTDSIGLACGRLRDGGEVIGWLFAVDCDADDPTLSAELDRITIARLGETTFVRFGRPNRWVRLYRSPIPVRSDKTLRQLEILGAGRQVLGFGIHPDTAEPYSWSPDGSPVEVKGSDLPLIAPDVLLAFLREIGSEADAPHNRPNCGRRLSGVAVIPLRVQGALNGRLMPAAMLSMGGTPSWRGALRGPAAIPLQPSTFLPSTPTSTVRNEMVAIRGPGGTPRRRRKPLSGSSAGARSPTEKPRGGL